MSLREYSQLDGMGLAQGIQNGDFSASDCVEAAIEKITEFDPKLNCVIYKNFEQAREMAQNDLSGPFAGLPFLIKDLGGFWQGMPTNFGSGFLQNYIPNHDSNLLKRYRNAGIIALGKTNVPEWGLKPVTDSVLSGECFSPWDTNTNSGGSSGGGAAAVASGMVPIAHGSDGGGSIRIPASCCGIFGLKPSRGRVPSGPDIGKGWQGAAIDHVLTRTVRDSAAFLDIGQGPDIGAPFLAPKVEGSFYSHSQNDPKKLKIALMEQPFYKTNQHPDCIAAMEQAAKKCEALGHDIVPTRWPLDGEHVYRAFMIMVSGEVAAMEKKLCEVLKREPKKDELEASTCMSILMGKHLSAQDFAYSCGVLDSTTRKLEEMFLDCDVLLMPTLAKPPLSSSQFALTRIEHSVFKLLHMTPSRKALLAVLDQMLDKIFNFIPNTPLFNITGQPAMSVPLYWNDKNQPIGVQFAAGFGREDILFQLAGQLERAEGGFRAWRPV